MKDKPEPALTDDELRNLAMRCFGFSWEAHFSIESVRQFAALSRTADRPDHPQSVKFDPKLAWGHQAGAVASSPEAAIAGWIESQPGAPGFDGADAWNAVQRAFDDDRAGAPPARLTVREQFIWRLGYAAARDSDQPKRSMSYAWGEPDDSGEEEGGTADRRPAPSEERPGRWCEACDVYCESNGCMAEDLCNHIKTGIASSARVEQCKERARLFNEARRTRLSRTEQPPSKPVAWLKHGPYEDGEPMVCVFEDPHDEDCYSALIYADPEFRTEQPAPSVLEGRQE